MESAAKKNSHGMLPRLSLCKLPRRPRKRMITQKIRPTVKSTCQSRPVVVQAAAKTPEKNDYPKNKADRQKHLPEPAQIQIFKTLVAKPAPIPPKCSPDSGIFAR